MLSPPPPSPPPPPSLRDPYLIALRSVTLPTHPPTHDYNRGEVLCAGFTIWDESSSATKVGQARGSLGSACIVAICTLQHCNSREKQKVYCPPNVLLFQITYYNQATPGVLPYISTDIVGLSSSFSSTFSSCSRFLEANKDGPAAPWPATARLHQCEGSGWSLLPVWPLLMRCCALKDAVVECICASPSSQQWICVFFFFK